MKPRVLQVLENENAFSENDSESETNEENADEDNGPEKQRDQQQMVRVSPVFCWQACWGLNVHLCSIYIPV